MNSYEAVIRKTLEIEDLLISKYNAYGKTFGDKIYSVQHKLPPKTVPKLHTLLKERNNLVHHGKYKVNKRQFKSLASETIRELKGKKSYSVSKKAVAISIGVAATAAGFMANRLMKK